MCIYIYTVCVRVHVPSRRFENDHRLSLWSCPWANDLVVWEAAELLWLVAVGSLEVNTLEIHVKSKKYTHSSFTPPTISEILLTVFLCGL